MLRYSVLRRASKVCDALVMFGTHTERLPFVSHPGVMAVAQLLEMKSLVEHRAHFTQDDVNRMYEFDSSLAEKAQVAVDHDLPISHYNLEYLDKPGFLERLLEEKRLNEAIASEVLGAPQGSYEQPASLSEYRAPEIPVEWRQHELALTHAMVDVQPSILREMETQKKMREFMARHQKK
ncbi:casein kinase II subunit beta [Babesia caballi]|uniref:Casein kinase II subunit beta n=1 Tax=Babesia caballi TaxID=5871 RepID=A0AAV4LUK5_BABCB|nr:casein kinase II subunit beta [Babesia caballi]